MTPIIIAFVCAVVLILLLLYASYKQDRELAALKEEAEAYKVTARELQRLYDESVHPEERLVQAEYCTSDSDIIKYSSQKAMNAAIKNKMAMSLSNDLLKMFEPSTLPLGEGKEKYSLVLKVRKI